MTDAGKQATTNALNDAARKEDERISKEEDKQKFDLRNKSEDTKREEAAISKSAAEDKVAEDAKAKLNKELADEAAKKAAEPAKTQLTKEQEQHLQQVKDTHQKIQDILTKYNGMESNIPVSHEYWGLQNYLRGLRNEPV